MAQSQSQSSPDKWNEIIEDLWEHLSHFKDKERSLLYDESCLKLDCITLQYVDGQESTSSDSITWLHQNTSDMEDSLVEIGETSSESKLITQSEPHASESMVWVLC